MAGCNHEQFEARAAVTRLEDVGRFVAEITVWCQQCQRRFQFLGLEAGLDTGGAMVSPDGLEARIAICPQGEEPSALDRIAVHFNLGQSH